MRVAITARGADLEAEVDPRFGRAAKFLIVDTATLSVEVVENTQQLDLPQGAGIQSAQNVSRLKPQAVLTGNCGPKAFKALAAAGIEVVVGVKGTIREAVQGYLAGDYQPAKMANVEGHWV